MRNWDVRRLIKASRLEIATAIGLVVAGSLLVIRLGSLPVGLSADELQTYRANLQLHRIAHSPLDAPYRLLDFAAIHLHQHSVAAARLTSVGFALLADVLFFLLVVRWHGRRSAWLGSVLFATSGWLLHVGRLGTDNVVWLGMPLALLLLGSWLGSTKRHGLALVVTALIFGVLLFVPAGIWFVATYVFLQRKTLEEHAGKAANQPLAIAALMLVLCAGALAFSLYRLPELLRPWLGLPRELPGVVAGLRQWADSALFLFVRGPGTPELWLAHTPILDVFSTAIYLLGIYFYATHFRNMRARMLGSFAVISSVLTALNGAPAMSLIVPLAYLVAATGLTYLLHDWLAVFPRNPLARGFGIALVCLAVLASATYHGASYFVAWQHSPTTKTTFTKTLL